MSALARWTLHGIRSVLTPDSAFGQYCDRLAAQPVDAQVAALRFLRATRPQRAEILLRRLIARHGTLDPGPAFAGELARLYVAMGRIAAADSIARASTPDLRHGIERLIVTASIVGLAPLADTRDAVHNLDAYVPPDSALLLRHPSRLVDRLDRCAHHASTGDSAIARRWQALFASMPAGGTTLDYRAALVADIDARILQRRDRSAEALVRARDAMRLWGIHTGNTAESQVSPAMRFHLAMLHKAAGQPDSARSLLRSLVPPTTWMGFLTARASFELGVLAEQQVNASRPCGTSSWRWICGRTATPASNRGADRPRRPSAAFAAGKGVAQVRRPGDSAPERRRPQAASPIRRRRISRDRACRAVAVAGGTRARQANCSRARRLNRLESAQQLAGVPAVERRSDPCAPVLHRAASLQVVSQERALQRHVG
jgi:hypothetical protein